MFYWVPMPLESHKQLAPFLCLGRGFILSPPERVVPKFLFVSDRWFCQRIRLVILWLHSCHFLFWLVCQRNEVRVLPCAGGLIPVLFYCACFIVFKKDDRVCSYLHSLGRLHVFYETPSYNYIITLVLLIYHFPK